MNVSIHNQTIALAAIYQAAKLVQQTARGERRDVAATRTSLQSVLVTDPSTVIDVYGSAAAILQGLETLLGQLRNDKRQRDMELTGYVISLMHIERKLIRQSALMNTLTEGIGSISEETGLPEGETDGPGLEELSIKLAELYRNTASNIQPRVMVKGDENVLRNVDSQRMVRALLLAALRSVVLWRQCGGSRLRLIFQRRRILECCKDLLEEARQNLPS